MRRRNPTSGCSATRCAVTPAQFAREDGVEETWRIVQPLLDAPPPVQPYEVGSWGPPAAAKLLSGHPRWREPWLESLMPTASRSDVADLVGDRTLSARSVLATALLGAPQPHLTVGELVAMASLFGISDGAARTCLWRMVSNGELTSGEGTYALAGGLLERRQRVDEASSMTCRDSAVGWHVGAGGRLAGPSVGGRPTCAAQSRDCTASRRTPGRRLDPPGQPRPGPPADTAHRPRPAMRSLSRRRDKHTRGDCQIPFRP